MQNGKTGICLQEVTASSLAASLCNMFQNRSLAYQMGRNAHKLITTKITMDNYAAKVELAVLTSSENSGCNLKSFRVQGS